jgi:NAD(P)-dependent dehydrogenase (short-subunit alcohol dehydrogenase family)
MSSRRHTPSARLDVLAQDSAGNSDYFEKLLADEFATRHADLTTFVARGAFIAGVAKSPDRAVRFGTPEQVAELVRWLASPRAAFPPAASTTSAAAGRRTEPSRIVGQVGRDQDRRTDCVVSENGRTLIVHSL